MTLLDERQKARRVRAMAGVTGHRSGSDTDKIKSEFAGQKATSGHSSEVLGYLANLPTTGHNPKLRKQARKFLGMRGHGCKPGEHMTFGVCRKVGEDRETVRGILERLAEGASDDERRNMGESADPNRMTQQQFWAAIDRASGDKFVTSTTVDWGSRNRGQGKRRGGMVMGGMSDAPKGKKSYADPLGKAPLTKDEMEEASSAETGSKILLAKALEAGFSSAVAFLVSYTVGRDAISREEAYQLATNRSVRSESAEMDWGDLESEVRDLAAVVRRKQIQAVLEAVDRINDMILKHVEL